MRSIIFHVIVFFFVTFGIPHTTKYPVSIPPPPMTIELVDVSKTTQSNIPPASVKPKAKERPNKNKPKPAKMDSPTPPDLSRPKAPEIEDNIAEPEPLPEPKALKKVLPPPKIQKKKPTPLNKKSVKKPNNDFHTLLKNLTPDTNKEEQTDFNDKKTTGDQESQIANLADKITVNETDELLQQLAGCWSLLSGAKFAENLVVPVKIIVNPDKTIKHVSVIDQGRYNRDNHYRAAADSAVRALKHPRCTPLRLPNDKYEQWRVMTINFDPRDML